MRSYSPQFRLTNTRDYQYPNPGQKFIPENSMTFQEDINVLISLFKINILLKTNFFHRINWKEITLKTLNAMCKYTMKYI